MIFFENSRWATSGSAILGGTRKEKKKNPFSFEFKFVRQAKENAARHAEKEKHSIQASQVKFGWNIHNSTLFITFMILIEFINF